MDSTKSVLQPIQHLRGLAAMAVVWHHAREQWLGSSIVLPGAHGDLGVDLFFVISGLIMVVSTDGRDLTPTRFLGRRLVRVVPLYWLATLSMVVLWLAMPSLFRSLVVTPEALAASLLFIPHFSVAFPDRIWPVLVPGWSLNYEMFFYAIFALTLTAPVRARVPGLCLLTGLLILLGATFEFESAMARTYTSPMLAQFCAGALVGWIWCRGKGRSTSAPVSWLLMIGALGFLTVVPDAGVW